MTQQVHPPQVGAGDQDMKAHITVALVGRPNSGKTSLLASLTGVGQKPVNFPGTSVERAEGSVQVDGTRLSVVDLPGISSVRALSRDEQVTLDYLRGAEQAPPDVLCVVVDASKLSVELHLLKQLAAFDLPTVVALNKQDVARKQGQPVAAQALSAALGIVVVETHGTKGAGVPELQAALVAPTPVSPTPMFDPDELTRQVQQVQSGAAGRTTWTDRLDKLFLHLVLGPIVLAAVIFGIFQLVFTVAEPFMAWVEVGQDWLAGTIRTAMTPGAVQSFLVDGLVNGVGSVLLFIPQIALLIAFVTILEGTGYMARAAFVLDLPLSRVGLSGRAFVPLTSSFACAIPGILATRIIDNERDRIATMVVAPLMSCSARLPVYVVLIGAFFPVAWAGTVLFSMYAIGVVTATVVALLLRRTILSGGRSMLAMELPVYQWPSPRVIGGQVWLAVREFLVLAGTVILATTIIVWVLSYYPRPDSIRQRFAEQRQQVLVQAPADQEQQLARIRAKEDGAYFEQSLLARFGKTIQPLFAPAGFDWRTTVGILAAFPAREAIIPAMGTLYSLGDVDAGGFTMSKLQAEATGPGPLREKLQNSKRRDGRPSFNALVALALMAFFALCSQCMATLGAIRRETHSWRWPLFTFGYMTVLAWLAAVVIYQVGSLLGHGLSG
ncbi:MAG: ferrous iron transport protein B [Planctomycetota bacterium]